MKILCPTDFSERARSAARVAVDLASRTGGTVELFHVVPPRTTDRVALSADAASLDEALRSDGQARLAAECRELAVQGVEVTSGLGDGDVESAILARAKAIAAGIIVMGAHARPAVERFVLGSAAERTLRRADRPVIIVPPGLDRLGGGPEGRRPLRIVVALDGRGASAGAIEFVRALRRHFASDVTFVRLYWPSEEYIRLGLTGERSLFEPDAEVVADLSRRMAIDVGALPGSGRMAFAVEPTWGDPATALLRYASKQDGDIVVMGAESRTGLARIAHPPVAERVAHHAHGAAVAFIPKPLAEPTTRQAPGIFTVLAATDLSAAGEPRCSVRLFAARREWRRRRALPRSRTRAALAAIRLRFPGGQAHRRRPGASAARAARAGAGASRTLLDHHTRDGGRRRRGGQGHRAGC